VKYRVIFIVILLLVLISAGIITYKVKENSPPESLLKEATQWLSTAKCAKAQSYALKEFNMASNYYDSAMLYWNQQNKKIIVSRNYDNVVSNGKQSIEYSKKSISKTNKYISDIKEEINKKFNKLDESISVFDSKFTNYPISKSDKAKYEKYKLILSESKLAFRNKEYKGCISKINSIETDLNEIIEFYNTDIEEYFQDYPKWKKDIEQSISVSKKSKTIVLIIDKYARELTVYKHGNIYKKYNIELGVNWVGDKMHQGDNTTPEGIYKITSKKNNGQTKYYKALLLNYPNEEDKKRFAENKKKGIIGRNAKIGNLIEIHGNGGKGVDWTQGCVALADSEMDDLYQICQVGTMVSIVGSAKKLSDLSEVAD